MRIAPGKVHESLARATLVEGYPMVLDLERSHGQWLVDARTGREYLDFFCFYASRPLAFDHPKLRDPDYLARLDLATRTKPSNGDIYTSLYAEFVETFRLKAMGAEMAHLFFIDGGALAVENTLKTAFDWKCRKNIAADRGEIPGQVIHFTHAFHGRSGYTLSLTNTQDARKTQYFPKFDWPRIPSPAIRFPLDEENHRATIAAEEQALAEIDRAYDRLGAHQIACIIVEPIQAEGGDRHFRPEFLRALRKVCDERDALLIFDEVQTGFATTGSMWLYEQLDVKPDLLAFAKKAMTGGLIAAPRIDEVDSVFRVKSRISSTFGGNLVDYVRCTRVLEIIEEDRLIENAKKEGAHLLSRVEELVQRHPLLSAPRGRGLLIAFDAPDATLRDKLIKDAREEGALLVLPCGERSVRLRPALDVSRANADEAISRLEASVARVIG